MSKHQCTVKLYDNEYRCMECYKQFVEAEGSDMTTALSESTPGLKPAMDRIKELEIENDSLRLAVEGLKTKIRDMCNPEHFRPLGNGKVKSSFTGEVDEPFSESIHDIPKDNINDPYKI